MTNSSFLLPALSVPLSSSFALVPSISSAVLCLAICSISHLWRFFSLSASLIRYKYFLFCVLSKSFHSNVFSFSSPYLLFSSTPLLVASAGQLVSDPLHGISFFGTCWRVTSLPCILCIARTSFPASVGAFPFQFLLRIFLSETLLLYFLVLWSLLLLPLHRPVPINPSGFCPAFLALLPLVF